MSLFGMVSGLAFSGTMTHSISSEMASTYQASKDAARASSKADQILSRMRALEANLCKAMMINEALWEIISDKHGISENELMNKINEIDMRDGKLDGKNQRKAVKCSSCGHMVSARHPACLYCGNIIDTSVFTVN